MTIKEIKKFAVFANFKKKELLEILKNSFTKTLSPKENLFTVGDKRDTFFIVLAGKLAILRQLGQTSQVVEIVTAGDYIVEHALYDPQSKHSHTLQAYGKGARVLAIPAKLFRKLPDGLKNKLLLNLLPIISDNFSHASNRIMALFQIGQNLGNKVLEINDLGQTILNILMSAIRAKKSLIALQEANPKKIRIIATWGFAHKNDPKGKVISLKDDDIFRAIIKQGKVMNLAPDKYFLRRKKLDYILHSVLGMPLQISDQNFGGILLIDKKSKSGFNTNNEVLLNIVAQMAALALYQAREQEIKKVEQELKRKYISM
jgi:CRP-like cAMP-binding protein